MVVAKLAMQKLCVFVFVRRELKLKLNNVSYINSIKCFKFFGTAPGCILKVPQLQRFSVLCYIQYLIFPFTELTPHGDGFYLAAVWAAMTLKWSFLMFWYTRKYRIYISDNVLSVSDRSSYEPI